MTAKKNDKEGSVMLYHPILEWFRGGKTETSAAFNKLAFDFASKAQQSAEATVALRKLLEARDAAERAMSEV